MTYDPDRDARAPADISPNRRPYERAGAKEPPLPETATPPTVPSPPRQ